MHLFYRLENYLLSTKQLVFAKGRTRSLCISVSNLVVFTLHLDPLSPRASLIKW